MRSHVLPGAEPDEFRRVFHGWMDMPYSVDALAQRRDAAFREAGRPICHGSWRWRVRSMQAVGRLTFPRLFLRDRFDRYRLARTCLADHREPVGWPTSSS
eukprot:scaffold175939_cov27-Tisochrysis_lutea.AAC.1